MKMWELPLLPTEIIGNIGRYLDFKTHTVLRSTCSSVRCYVPRLRVVGFQELKELVEEFGINRECYQKKHTFQEWIHLDSDPRKLTEQHLDYLVKLGLRNELRRLSRFMFDDPTSYEDVILFNDGVFLVQAASYGDLDLFTRLLKVPNMNTPNARRLSMSFAVSSSHLDIVQLLIPSMTVKSGNSAILMASRHGHVAIVRSLLEDGRSDPNHFITLIEAAEQGHLEVVQALLEDGRSDPSALNNSALRYAAQNGHLAVVQALLQDVRVDPSDSKNSALCRSADGNHHEICSLLLTDPRVLVLYRSDPFDLPDMESSFHL